MATQSPDHSVDAEEFGAINPNRGVLGTLRLRALVIGKRIDSAGRLVTRRLFYPLSVTYGLLLLSLYGAGQTTGTLRLVFDSISMGSVVYLPLATYWNRKLWNETLEWFRLRYESASHPELDESDIFPNPLGRLHLMAGVLIGVAYPLSIYAFPVVILGALYQGPLGPFFVGTDEPLEESVARPPILPDE